MMHSFENRGDCAAVDEPFHAYYLAGTQFDHPGRDEVPHATAQDIGVPQEADLYDEISKCTGAPPPVINAAEFLKQPEAHLRALCEFLGIPVTPRMLHWPAGSRASDGVFRSDGPLNLSAPPGKKIRFATDPTSDRA